MTINRKLDFVILDIVENAARTIRTAPLNLGGLPGGGGGVGAPPGGYVGWLPQTRVAYDYDEIASSGIPASGVSLLDNLNHIRYRLNILESGGSITIVDDNEAISYLDTTHLHFSGTGVTVVDLGNGEVSVQISDTGGPGSGISSIIVQEDSTTIGEVTTLNFRGINVGVDVTVSGSVGTILISGIDPNHIYNEDLTDQIPSSGFSTQYVYESGTLRLYYNGVRQRKEYNYWEFPDGTFTVNFTTYSGDTIIVDYDCFAGGSGGSVAGSTDILMVQVFS